MSWLAWVVLCFSVDTAIPAELARSFRVSAVQESQVWIESGLLDGLEQGMKGEICYQITIAGNKKRIIPAKVCLSKTEDRESIGTLYEQSGLPAPSFAPVSRTVSVPSASDFAALIQLKM